MNNHEFDTISNEQITLQVSSALGAQIKSLIKNNTEMMWQGDPKYWGRTSPVLFPFVGKLKDNQYQSEGKIYPMTQHGFLRDRCFDLVSSTVDELVYQYKSTAGDYGNYPFKFICTISYKLVGDELITSYEVVNNDSKQMSFQIGAHPAFNIENVDLLSAHFPKQRVTKYWMEDGLQKRREEIELEEIDLSYNLINENLPCFSDFKTKQMSLKVDGEDFLDFKFDTMEHLAIWSPEGKNAKFICVEPWVGICSKSDQVGYDLADKDAMTNLQPNERFKCEYTIKFY